MSADETLVRLQKMSAQPVREVLKYEVHIVFVTYVVLKVFLLAWQNNADPRLRVCCLSA